MNPSLEDFNKMLSKSGYNTNIDRTKKRSTKSVDLHLKNREQSQFMQTNKTLQLIQNASFNRSRDLINNSQN